MIHHRKTMRLLAPLILLLTLTACSDKQQASDFYQHFADTKNPGVTAVVRDALGVNGNTKDVQAAIDATTPIKDLEEEERSKQQLTEARATGNVAQAQTALERLKPIKEASETQILAGATAVQLGTPDASDKIKEIDNTGDKLTAEAANNRNANIRAQLFNYSIIDELKNTLIGIGKANLTSRERHKREVVALAALANAYRRLAGLCRADNMPSFGDIYDRDASRYQQEINSLVKND